MHLVAGRRAGPQTRPRATREAFGAISTDHTHSGGSPCDDTHHHHPTVTPERLVPKRFRTIL
eukprot:3249014-Prymnesium_polylepis.1